MRARPGTIDEREPRTSPPGAIDVGVSPGNDQRTPARRLAADCGLRVCPHHPADLLTYVFDAYRGGSAASAGSLGWICSSAVMCVRSCALIASALALTFCAAAVASALPKAHRDYMYVRHGKLAFAINLATRSAKQLMASMPRSKTFPSSSLLVLCQGASGSPTELQMGFPGAALTLRNRHYGFRVSYTEKRADLVIFGKSIIVTHESAQAIVTGTVETAKLIAGGCRETRVLRRLSPP